MDPMRFSPGDGNNFALFFQVANKYIDTYKVGMAYWPTVQTLNFAFVPLKNQVVCASFFSMLWSSFLAYEKHLEIKTKNPNEVK